MTNKYSRSLADFQKEDRIYEGYIWSSEKPYPNVLRNEPYKDYLEWKDNSTPYIVEALLYCPDSNCSWMIKHNGSYQIFKYDLKECKEEGELLPVDFLPHRLKEKNPKSASAITSVCFQQFWKAEKDENCNDWEVLTMKALIFTGFNHQVKLNTNA